jgi:uncharacterized repeat protein (TIGR03803 family)
MTGQERDRSWTLRIDLWATIATYALALLMIVLATQVQAQTYIPLHHFKNTPDGWEPWGGLTMDKAGNLYGATQYGGDYRSGLVFKMVLKGSSWVLYPLYNFANPLQPRDGAEPMARLTIGPDGSLYGTTLAGGTCCGTVFNLKPPPGACKSFICTWTETILYRFSGGSDGDGPEAPVIFDQAGNIYGTTVSGGSANDGVVFKLTKSGSGWTESVLHSFSGPPDGASPASGLVFDQASNLYGTTVAGGSSLGGGVVFELTPSGAGWTETILHTFDYSTDGAGAYGGVIFDPAGNLYGTTAYGPIGNGSVFELTPSGGQWNFSLLHALTSGQEGVPGPLGPLAMDAAGNLYGTTYQGGDVYGVTCEYGCGSVFKLAPSGGGWLYSLLYAFTADDDGFPVDGPILDQSGNLYGTASGTFGGYGGGVFEITP